MDKMGEGGRGRRCHGVAIWGPRASFCPSVRPECICPFLFYTFHSRQHICSLCLVSTTICPRYQHFAKRRRDLRTSRLVDDRTSSSDGIWTTLKYITTKLFYVINFGHTPVQVMRTIQREGPPPSSGSILGTPCCPAGRGNRPNRVPYPIPTTDTLGNHWGFSSVPLPGLRGAHA